MDAISPGVATEPCQLTAAPAAALIRAKRLSCEELVRSCLARIAAGDADVRAWLWLEPDHVIRRARELDKLPAILQTDEPREVAGSIFRLVCPQGESAVRMAHLRPFFEPTDRAEVFAEPPPDELSVGIEDLHDLIADLAQALLRAAVLSPH